MSNWYADVKRVFKYECRSCKQHHHFEMRTGDHDQAAIEQRGLCDACGMQGFDYQGFATNAEDMPAVAIGVQHETFEQNGRKGVKIGKTYISATRLHYLKTGEIQNQYTKEYEQHLLKDREKNEYLLTTERNRRRAVVTKASPRLAKA